MTFSLRALSVAPLSPLFFLSGECTAGDMGDCILDDDRLLTPPLSSLLPPPRNRRRRRSVSFIFTSCNNVLHNSDVCIRERGYVEYLLVQCPYFSISSLPTPPPLINEVDEVTSLSTCNRPWDGEKKEGSWSERSTVYNGVIGVKQLYKYQ